MSWNLSNENLLELIDNLRLAGRGGYFLNNDGWEMLCDDAANALEAMIQYEAGHGLRSAIESEDKE
jgi:hypothetical protein